MNRGEKMIKAYAKSDVGKVREMNQDYYYISNSLDEVQLYILADGMGGYNGGEIASKIAVETAKNYIEKLGRKALIHTNTGDIYQCNKNLDEIWSQLDKRMFASIRVACIVNLSEIVQVVRDELLLKNGNTLHVGRAYRQEIKLRHLQFLKEQL